MSDIPVAPLDAYITARPDEPTFTLQGGDPLAEPLVKIWVGAARLRAGVSIGDFLQEAVDDLHAACVLDCLESNERERNNLLVRATAAEEVSWAMRDYRLGNTSAGVDQPTAAGENFLDEKARLDLHDLRVRFAQRLSGFFSEMSDMRTDLKNASFLAEELDNQFEAAILLVRQISNTVEPRRLMKGS